MSEFPLDLYPPADFTREDILRQIFGEVGELCHGKFSDEVLIFESPPRTQCVPAAKFSIDFSQLVSFILMRCFFVIEPTDFSCAVETKVLLHGRMYVTNRFLCFYSNLFGVEKKIRIPYSHITLITKENTALVIPNAIAIATCEFIKKLDNYYTFCCSMNFILICNE